MNHYRADLQGRMYLEKVTSIPELKSCLTQLKEKLPRSFYFVEHLKVLLEYKFNDFDIYKVKARCGETDTTVLFSVCEDTNESLGKYAVFYEEKDAELVINALADTVDWSKRNFLHSFPHYQRPLLQRVLSVTGASIEHDTKCFVFALHDVKRLPVMQSNKESEVKKINPDLAHVINANWKFRSRTSENRIRDELENGIGYGAFVDGKMVSWAVVSRYGPISHLHTLPEARGRGYAGMVVSKLSRDLYDLSITPFADVEIDNQAAIKLFEKLGFEIQWKSSWLLLAPSGVQGDDKVWKSGKFTLC